MKIGGLRASMLPLPHLVIDGITVGKTGDLKVGRSRWHSRSCCRARPVKVIRSLEIDSLVLTQKAVDKIPAWTRPESGKPQPSQSQLQVVVRSIRLDNALVKLDKISFGPFDARLRLNSDGTPEDASVTTQDGKLKAFIKPDKSNYLIDISAKSWKLPAGPAILFDELTIKGVATLSDANLNQINARLYGGTVNGKASIGWRKGLQFKGNLDVRQVELKNLVPLLAPGNRMSGKFNAKPVFSANAAAAAQIMNALRLETPFDVKNGVLYGVDIEKSATSLFSRDKAGGGETHFDVLSGHLGHGAGHSAFHEPQDRLGFAGRQRQRQYLPEERAFGTHQRRSERGETGLCQRAAQRFGHPGFTDAVADRGHGGRGGRGHGDPGPAGYFGGGGSGKLGRKPFQQVGPEKIII